MITIEVKVSAAAYQWLKGLVVTGLFGNSVEEAAERIICQSLDDRNREQAVLDDRASYCPVSKNGYHFDGCGCA